MTVMNIIFLTVTNPSRDASLNYYWLIRWRPGRAICTAHPLCRRCIARLGAKRLQQQPHWDRVKANPWALLFLISFVRQHTCLQWRPVTMNSASFAMFLFILQLISTTYTMGQSQTLDCRLVNFTARFPTRTQNWTVQAVLSCRLTVRHCLFTILQYCTFKLTHCSSLICVTSDIVSGRNVIAPP